MSRKNKEKKQMIQARKIKKIERKEEEFIQSIQAITSMIHPNNLEVGVRGGLCNRSSCREPGASWYNRGSLSWYCTRCAHTLNDANRFAIFQDGRKMCIPVPEDSTDEQVRELTKFVPCLNS